MRFPGSALPHKFRVNGSPCNSQCLRMCKFSYHGNIMWKAISFLGCRSFRKLEVIRKPQRSPEHESNRVSYYGNTIWKATRFMYYGFWQKINWVRQPTQFPDTGNCNPGQHIWNRIDKSGKTLREKKRLGSILCVFNCYCQLFEGRLGTGLMIFPNLKFF